MSERGRDKTDKARSARADAQLERVPGKRTLTDGVSREPSAPGKRTNTEALPPTSVPREPVQLRVDGRTPEVGVDTNHVYAAEGVADADSPLPYNDQIQRAFGRHDISNVKVSIGGGAARASKKIGARAYARGDRIAFGDPPDLHTAAHEAAHVVQQRRGVNVTGGIGSAGDAYEQHADRVADIVVAGGSAEAALGEMHTSGGAAPIVQKDSDQLTAAQYIDRHEADLVTAAHNTAMAQPFAINIDVAKLGDVHKFAVAALKGLAATSQIREWLAPKKLDDIVHRVRVHGDGDAKDATGPAEWMPSVGTTVGAALGEKIQDSLNRVLGRYLDARYQALLAEEAKAGTCLLVAPEPTEASVVGSHPIDRQVIGALCTGCVSFDVDKYRAAHADGKPLFKKPRAVAFMWESATNGTYWIRVTDKEPASPEDVALTLFGASEHAFEITGTHPLFGFTHANKLAEPHRGYLLGQGENLDAEGDPNTELLEAKSNLGPVADELAQAQGAGAATGSSKQEIVEKMRVNLQSLDEVIALAGKFDLAARLAGARQRLDEKSRQLAKPETPFAEVAKWDGQVNLQALAIQRANFGLDGLRERLEAMTKGMENLPPTFAELKLPDYAKRALLKPALAYVDGAACCHLPTTADAKLAEADRLAIFAPLELLDGMLTEVVRVLRDEAKGEHSKALGDGHDGYQKPDTAADLVVKEKLLRAELARVRTLILTNPQAAGLALKQLSQQIQDVSSEAEIIGNMDELDRLWTQILNANLNGPGFDPGQIEADSKRNAERSRALRKRVDDFTKRWRTAYTLWKKGDKAGAKTIVDGIKHDPGLPALLADCNQLFQDAADVAALNKLALVFAVTLVTMGVGAWVEGVALGLELGTGATILAVSAAEAVSFVALSQVFLDTDHSVGHIATELAFNFVMFATLRRFSKFIEAANMGKVVKVGVAFTGQTLITTAAGLARAEIESLVRTGKHLTETQIKQICLESVVQAVAITISTQGFTPIMEELQSFGKGLGSQIKIANQKAAAVEQLTNALKGKATVDDALAAIKAHREWADAKLKAFETLEQIIEQEKVTPPKKGESVFDKTKLTEEQIAALKESVKEASATMKAAEAMLTLEPTGPNTFSCPKERIGKVLEELGNKPLSVTEDAVTKLKTYTIKGPDGKVIKIVETSLGPNAAGTGHTNANAPSLELGHLPESSQSIARWQTDGISHDAPDLWAKESEGRSFKDVYAEWMKQPERVRKLPDGSWEPVYPKDCPKDFRPVIADIVKRGNITLTTQGEANVAKLKEAGIDLEKLDPLSPEYFAQRDKIVSILGEDAVRRWEATKTETASAAKAETTKRVNSVLPESSLAALRAAFPDCEIVVSGSLSQTGKPLTGPKGVKDVDIMLVVPEGTPMENRIAMERRASGMKLPTTSEFQKAGGPAELDVDAKAMTQQEYLGLRTADPGKRTPLGDVRVDSHTAKAVDVAKQYNVSNDPAQLKAFEAAFNKHPVDTARWAHALKNSPGLAGRLLARLGEAAMRHYKPTGNGTLDVHGRIEITPEKLASLSDADIERLAHVCQNDGPKTDYEYFEASQSDTKPGYRLRFTDRLATRANETAALVLKDLNIDPADPRAAIFKNMAPGEQSRMWDLRNEGEFSNTNLRKQAEKWALSKSPKSARQFVADFQLYAAEVGRRTTEIVDAFKAKVEAEYQKRSAASSVDRAALEQEMAKKEFGATNAEKIRKKARDRAVGELDAEVTTPDGQKTTLGAQRADAALKTNLEAQKDAYATGGKDLGAVPSAELEARVKAAADTISFGDAHDAAYHAHKHAPEMSSKPSASNEMVEYLKAARETIKNGTAEPIKPAQRDAGRSLTFVNANGDRCIVFVDGSGTASIATFMPKTK